MCCHSCEPEMNKNALPPPKTRQNREPGSHVAFRFSTEYCVASIRFPCSVFINRQTPRSPLDNHVMMSGLALSISRRLYIPLYTAGCAECSPSVFRHRLVFPETQRKLPFASKLTLTVSALSLTGRGLLQSSSRGSWSLALERHRCLRLTSSTHSLKSSWHRAVSDRATVPYVAVEGIVASMGGIVIVIHCEAKPWFLHRTLGRQFMDDFKSSFLQMG